MSCPIIASSCFLLPSLLLPSLLSRFFIRATLKHLCPIIFSQATIGFISLAICFSFFLPLLATLWDIFSCLSPHFPPPNAICSAAQVGGIIVLVFAKRQKRRGKENIAKSCVERKGQEDKRSKCTRKGSVSIFSLVFILNSTLASFNCQLCLLICLSSFYTCAFTHIIQGETNVRQYFPLIDAQYR